MAITEDILEASTLLLISALVFLLFFIVVYYLNVLRPFLRKREYIKMEINRSNEDEYIYWKRQLKRLYIYYIPIVGRLICKLIK